MNCNFGEAIDIFVVVMQRNVVLETLLTDDCFDNRQICQIFLFSDELINTIFFFQHSIQIPIPSFPPKTGH